jgi:SH3-like domain-containing protein
MRAAIPLLLLLLAGPAWAQENADGTTNLPIPRFVSLKSNKAMMRSGPDDQRFPILWEYRRQGLPMEVLQEVGIWRQVRDPEGTVGWMNKSLLRGTRTALVLPPERILYVAPDTRARVAWRVEPGTILNITLCEGAWCRVSNQGRSGFIPRAQLHGTYKDEKVGG